MHVKGSTTYRLVPGTLRESLLLGALLLVTLLTVLAAPCERELCDRADGALPSQAQTTPVDTQPSPPDALEHCALHCGLLIFPLLLLAVSSPHTARVTLTTPALRLRLTPPPLLPPPQPA
ncbi:MAG: hypothetical protein OHK0015_12300 [Chloroflexi bacterium OHK40]